MSYTKAENAGVSDSWKSLLEARDYTSAATLLRPLVAKARASYLHLIGELGLDAARARDQLERLVEKDLRSLEFRESTALKASEGA